MTVPKAKAHEWACERLATCLRSTGTKVKTQGAVIAVDGNKRGDLELVGYIGDGAQDLVLDIVYTLTQLSALPRALRRGTGTGTESSFTLATLTRTLTRRRQARLPSTASSIGTG